MSSRSVRNNPSLKTRRSRTRKNRRPARHLEELESRILLAASVVDVKWIGPTNGIGGDGVSWEDKRNWIITTPGDPNINHEPDEFPENDATHLYDVTIDNTAGDSPTINVDEDIAISNLTIKGNSGHDLDATLDFEGNYTIDLLASGTAPQTDGNLHYIQGANHVTSLTLDTNGSDVWGHAYNGGIVGQGLLANDTVGSGKLTINSQSFLHLNLIDTNHNKFDLVDDGSILAKTVYIMGRDMPVSGNPDVSTVQVNGSMAVSAELRIGGEGITNFNVVGPDNRDVDPDQGELTAGKVFVVNGSSFLADHNASIIINGQVLLGEPNTFAIGTQLYDYQGPTFTLTDNSKIDNTAASPGLGGFFLTGGKSTSLFILSGSTLDTSSVYALGGRPGDEGTGPEIHVTGQDSLLEAVKYISIGNGQQTGGFDGPKRPSTMLVDNEGKVKIDHGGYFEIVSRLADGPTLLTVASGIADAVLTDKLYIGLPNGGVPPGAPNNWYGSVKIEADALGNGTSITVLDEFIIGNGTTARGMVFGRHPVVFTVAVQCIVDAPGVWIDKRKYADITGDGTIRSAAHPGGVKADAPGADFIPGAYTVDDAGNLVSDTGSADPFGTLTVDGDLDASIGMTLDSILGQSSGENNTLAVHVSGDSAIATISGNLNVYLADDVDSTEYAAGDSFTVLTADHLKGQFTNLPEGYYQSDTDGLLPDLGDGLYWHVDYTDTAVTLKVCGPSLPTDYDLDLSGVELSPDPIDIGGPVFRSGQSFADPWWGTEFAYDTSLGEAFDDLTMKYEIVGDKIYAAVIDANDAAPLWMSDLEWDEGSQTYVDNGRFVDTFAGANSQVFFWGEADYTMNLADDDSIVNAGSYRFPQSEGRRLRKAA